MKGQQLDFFQKSIVHTNSYHNSVPLTDSKQLDEYEKKAESQDEKILRYFKNHPNQSFTPSEIYLLFGQCWPLTSVRRSITNLTKKGELIMTEELKPGLFGRENNCWSLNKSK